MWRTTTLLMGEPSKALTHMAVLVSCPWLLLSMRGPGIQSGEAGQKAVISMNPALMAFLPKSLSPQNLVFWFNQSQNMINKRKYIFPALMESISYVSGGWCFFLVVCFFMKLSACSAQKLICALLLCWISSQSSLVVLILIKSCSLNIRSCCRGVIFGSPDGNQRLQDDHSY